MTNAILMSLLIGGMMQGIFSGNVVTDLGNTNARGKPFCAKFEQLTVQQAPNGGEIRRSVLGSVYRDSDGRYRQEVRFDIAPGKSLHIAYIQDPVAHLAYVLDLSNRALLQEEPLISAEVDVTIANRSSEAGATHEWKDIEGLTCRVYKIQTNDGVTVELSFSDDLEMVLFETRVSLAEKAIMRLHSIRRVEPERSLFVLPKDYKSPK